LFISSTWRDGLKDAAEIGLCFACDPPVKENVLSVGKYAKLGKNCGKAPVRLRNSELAYGAEFRKKWE